MGLFLAHGQKRLNDSWGTGMTCSTKKRYDVRHGEQDSQNLSLCWQYMQQIEVKVHVNDVQWSTCKWILSYWTERKKKRSPWYSLHQSTSSMRQLGASWANFRCFVRQQCGRQGFDLKFAQEGLYRQMFIFALDSSQRYSFVYVEHKVQIIH